jgi:CrcB protein
MPYLWVAIGGALGSVARYGSSSMITRAAGAEFPFGTLFVNVTGAIAIGVFAATLPPARLAVPPSARLFLMTGICGGYTTFSAFSLETLSLIRSGSWPRALANIVLSVGLCLIAVWLGQTVALRQISRQA